MEFNDDEKNFQIIASFVRYIQHNIKKIQTINKEKQKLRKMMKTINEKFLSDHGRPPRIDEKEKLIGNLYEDYKKVRLQTIGPSRLDITSVDFIVVADEERPT